MKIYISIPISNHNLATQRAKATEIAEKIKALGHEPVNPFDTPEAPADMDEREKYSYYMGEDIKRLLMCDGVYFHSGWHKSKGCNVEFTIAFTYKLKIFLCLSDGVSIDEIIPKSK